jgi:hypothetical protein
VSEIEQSNGMQAKDVEILGRYVAEVTGRRVVVQITSRASTGWWATNEATGRQVRIKTARCLSQMDGGASDPDPLGGRSPDAL